MIPHLHNLTPEQWAERKAKSAQTRLRNKQLRAGRWQKESTLLEKHTALANISIKLTSKTLLSEGEIVSRSDPWGRVSGVYFLISDQKIVYVGQSLCIFSRIDQHKKVKRFDRFAYIPCEKTLLDSLESLYIHCLRPPLNGYSNGLISAPMQLDKLLRKAAGKSEYCLTGS
jgi:hypothetical protein